MEDNPLTPAVLLLVIMGLDILLAIHQHLDNILDQEDHPLAQVQMVLQVLVCQCLKVIITQEVTDRNQ